MYTRFPRTPLVLVLLSWSFAFCILGILLLYVRAGATAASEEYISTPEFKVWAALTIAMIAALPVIWHMGISLLVRLGTKPRHVLLRSWVGPVLALIVLAIALAGFLAGKEARGNGSPFYGGPIRIVVVYLVVVAASTPAVVAMWECYRQAEHLPSDSADITRQLLLRECLLSSLSILGSVVSLGVFVVGAERLAVLADAKLAGTFPASYVLVWGFSFSAILLINFLPAFQRLNRAARDTIDSLFPILKPGANGWQNRLQERKDLADLLKVTGATKDVVTSTILVAGPLISSAFALFLPGGSG